MSKPPDTFTLDIYDLLADTDYKNTIEKLADQLQSGMDLEKGLLMKLGLFRTMRGDYLLIAIHHMVIDGVSWRILLEDMEQVYNNLQKESRPFFRRKRHPFKNGHVNWRNMQTEVR